MKSSPTNWIRGRLHVELGKLADLDGRRPDAVGLYRTAKSICQASADTVCQAEADRLIRKPFVLGAR
jgi:hypothetical protein